MNAQNRRSFLTRLGAGIAAFVAAWEGVSHEKVAEAAPPPVPQTRERLVLTYDPPPPREEPPAEPDDTIRCESVSEMLDAIRAHVANTADSVMCFDNPKTRVVGFATLGVDGQISKVWGVGLVKIKIRAGMWPGDLWQNIGTAAGRKRIASEIPGQRRSSV